MEVQALYAANIVVGFGRLNGRSVGIVANQPMEKAVVWISMHPIKHHDLYVFVMPSIYQ